MTNVYFAQKLDLGGTFNAWDMSFLFNESVNANDMNEIDDIENTNSNAIDSMQVTLTILIVSKVVKAVSNSALGMLQ